jgi:4-amino-4-deoxy-L-arabinose transferase-like glycosyltransferase
MTEGRRRGLALIDRLLDALADTARRERTVVVLLLGYVALWTLYGAIAKGSQDIHADMSEQFALGRELALGYPKHPPLAMVVVRAWFSVFPTADWAYYLLAMVNVGLALWIAWRLSARFLDGEKRVIGLALLTLVPFFNFHGLKFNVNTILLPLWAATTLWFLRSFETRRVFDAALAGLFAAAGRPRSGRCCWRLP